jgi:isopenicillin N synthase-like dioxygenase
MPGPHPLQSAYEALFSASQAFFKLDDAEKNKWKHKLGSEEGWSKIPGEKEFITLRTLEYCPDILKQPAKNYWDLMGSHLSSTLSRIATSLALPDDALTRFVGPCGVMQNEDSGKSATMLRLFRYEGHAAKVVAEPHSDLGLLSVVVGDVPGLEVWNGHGWFDVEREVKRAGMCGASLLVGRQLERLSNQRYGAGGHRVVSYGAPESATTQREPRYRFSIVFVLRAHEPVIVDSDALETQITGEWDEGEKLRGVEVGEWYKGIRGRHYNINIDVGERERQRRSMAGKKGGK